MSVGGSSLVQTEQVMISLSSLRNSLAMLAEGSWDLVPLVRIEETPERESQDGPGPLEGTTACHWCHLPAPAGPSLSTVMKSGQGLCVVKGSENLYLGVCAPHLCPHESPAVVFECLGVQTLLA